MSFGYISHDASFSTVQDSGILVTDETSVPETVVEKFNVTHLNTIETTTYETGATEVLDAEVDSNVTDTMHASSTNAQESLIIGSLVPESKLSLLGSSGISNQVWTSTNPIGNGIWDTLPFPHITIENFTELVDISNLDENIPEVCIINVVRSDGGDTQYINLTLSSLRPVYWKIFGKILTNPSSMFLNIFEHTAAPYSQCIWRSPGNFAASDTSSPIAFTNITGGINVDIVVSGSRFTVNGYVLSSAF